VPWKIPQVLLTAAMMHARRLETELGVLSLALALFPLYSHCSEYKWNLCMNGWTELANIFSWRLTIPETPRYTFDVAHDIEKAHADIKAYMNNEAEGSVDPIIQEKTRLRQGKNLRAPKASWRDAFTYFSQWKNFKVLFGTTASWFLLDLAF
jgi:hypothetical protein